MITNLIVGLSVAFAVALLLANWLVPALRRQIEQPKYIFQEQLQRFDSQRQDAQATSSDQTKRTDKGSTNETR